MGSAASPISKIGDALGGKVGKALTVLSPATWLQGGMARTIAGVGTMIRAPKDAADQMAKVQEQQAKEQAALLKQIQLQPQLVAGDNFAAQKRSEMDRLRLGVAATLKTGRAGGGAASVYSPTLKAKLGQ